MFFKLSIVIFIIFYITHILSGENCLTPNLEKATCIPLNACLPLLNITKNQTGSVQAFLRRSRCNSAFAKEPLVCCGSFGDYQDDIVLSDRRYCGYQHSDDYSDSSKKLSVSIDEFPWLALLMYRNKSDVTQSVSLCSGTLINDKFVLTAGQCLYIPGFELVGVRLGEYDTRTVNDCIETDTQSDCSQTVDFSISEKILHENYNETLGVNDIALLRLNFTIFEYSDYMRPICLPIASLESAGFGDTLLISGWGNGKNEKDSVFVKRKVFARYMSDDECIDAYRNSRRTITDKHFCTKDLDYNVEFSCRGDAGAPVMFHNRHQWHIEGISSGGVDCGSEFPNVHAKVKDYLSWILKYVKPLF